MLVAASTACFAELALPEAVARLNDLEYTNIEILIHESGGQLATGQILDDLESAVRFCRDTHRLNVVALRVEMPPEADAYYEKFTAICRLAKAIKVVTVAMPSGELGTPFNEEVERLREWVAIASREGTRVSVRTQDGRLSEDPDTAVVLCDNVEGLGITLDPSHFTHGIQRGRPYAKLMKYTHHVLLRDSNQDAFQVRVGQGEIEYGRLVNQLRKVDYNRALCVDMVELPNVDHAAELRKLRLLLESLL